MRYFGRLKWRSFNHKSDPKKINTTLQSSWIVTEEKELLQENLNADRWRYKSGCVTFEELDLIWYRRNPQLLMKMFTGAHITLAQLIQAASSDQKILYACYQHTIVTPIISKINAHIKENNILVWGQNSCEKRVVRSFW